MRVPLRDPVAGAYQTRHGLTTTSLLHYDWMPTLVEIAGGPKGNDLNAELEQGKYPGIVKTKLARREPDRLS